MAPKGLQVKLDKENTPIFQKQPKLQKRVSGFEPQGLGIVDKEETKSGRRNSHVEVAVFGNKSADQALSAAFILLQGSILLGIHMLLVYMMGSWSVGSHVVIYAPITVMTLVLIRDGYHPYAIVSALIAISHGLMHQKYPFLDEHVGVVRDVDVWQDQVVHASQAVLFVAIWWDKLPKLGKLAGIVFLLGNATNCVVGYFCWNGWCYDLYVWVSMFAAIAGGLHFAVAAMLKCPPGVGKWLCAFQGVQTVFFFFFFKSSDDILKFFAATRFFESYNICAHFIGFINARLDLYHLAPKDCTSPMAHVLGLERTPKTRRQSVELATFFPAETVKA